MAAAVLRPTGSARTWGAGTRGSSRRTATVCSVLVTTQQLRSEKAGTRRFTVSRNMVSPPVMFSNCLGVRTRLRGQKRVPRPPARSTAQAGRSFCFFFLIISRKQSRKHQAFQVGLADTFASPVGGDGGEIGRNVCAQNC